MQYPRLSEIISVSIVTGVAIRVYVAQLVENHAQLSFNTTISISNKSTN
jgi:hypothetical protein